MRGMSGRRGVLVVVIMLIAVYRRGIIIQVMEILIILMEAIWDRM